MSPEKRLRFEKLQRLVLIQLTLAIGKHPDFIKSGRFFDLPKMAKSINETSLPKTRFLNANGHECAESVFLEELEEFHEACFNGDLKNAEIELAQCIAVLIRTFDCLPKLIEDLQKELATA